MLNRMQRDTDEIPRAVGDCVSLLLLHDEGPHCTVPRLTIVELGSDQKDPLLSAAASHIPLTTVRHPASTTTTSVCSRFSQ